MNTMQILSAAYADIFGIELNKGGCYAGQKTADGCEIDYADFNAHYIRSFDIDSDYVEALTEDGSEGCWIRVNRVRFNGQKHEYEREIIGTIKTLAEGRPAWRAMGALAGELAYMATGAAWRLYKAEQEAKA